MSWRFYGGVLSLPLPSFDSQQITKNSLILIYGAFFMSIDCQGMARNPKAHLRRFKAHTGVFVCLWGFTISNTNNARPWTSCEVFFL